MRFLRIVLPIAVFVSSTPLLAQTPERDQRAVEVLQRSIVALGGRAPVDSVASGSVTLTSGGSEETATFRILTRGLTDYREELRAASGEKTLTLTARRGTAVYGAEATKVPFLTAKNDRFGLSPGARLISALSNSDMAASYLGVESENGLTQYHLRIWETFASAADADMKSLADRTATELWIDSVTFLPRSVAYKVFVPLSNDPISVEITFLDYGTTAGIAYPTRIQKKLNGTPYAVIVFDQTRFNVGLTDRDFASN